jgi:hypothetical protein
MKTRKQRLFVERLTAGASLAIAVSSRICRLLSLFVAGSIFTGLPLAEVWAQSPADYTPMDPIPEVVELPDPCDNPTTQMWGPEDELGNLNYLAPERVRENLSLIRLGKVYQLAHTVEPGQMGFSAYFDFKMNPGEWPGGGSAHTIFNNEETIGHSTFNRDRAGVLNASIGTQFDGFNHTTQGGITYNCFDTRDPASHLLPEGDPGDLPKGNPGDDYIFRGHSRSGIENVGTIVARAVLIDVGQLLREREAAAGRDPDQFPPVDYEFSPEELEQALIRQGMTLEDIRPGDGLLVRTGWGARYWTSNPADPRNESLKYFNGGQEEFRPAGPGLDSRAVQWTINRKPVLVGADNTSVESNIPVSPGHPSVSHGHLAWLSSGIYMMEDLDLEVLAADCEAERVANMAEYGEPAPPDDEANCYAFALIVQTTPIRGFTGSTVAPTAIR